MTARVIEIARAVGIARIETAGWAVALLAAPLMPPAPTMSVQPVTITSGSVVGAPRVAGAGRIAPSTLTGGGSVSAPAVVAITMIQPQTIAGGSGTLPPAVSAGAASVQPALLPPGNAVPLPVVALVAAAPIAVTTIAAASTVPAPAVAVQGTVVVAPTFIVSSATVAAPALAAGTVAVMPAAIAGGSMMLPPNIAAGTVAVAPAAIASTAIVAEPSVVAATSEDSATTAYLAAMSVAPSSPRRTLINDVIVGLKADGVWSKLDWVSLVAGHEGQAGRINARAPSQVASAVNSPIFTVDRGYAGDGSSAFLDSGVPQTTAGLYGDNAGMIFAWVNADANTATGNPVIGLVGSPNSYINPRTGSTIAGRINAATGVTSAVPDRLGLSAVDRSAVNSITNYRNGSALTTNTSTITPARAAGDWAVFRSASVYATSRVAAWGYGASLTAAEHAALYNRLSTYLNAIGAA